MRYSVEVERLDERRGEIDLPVGEEPTELLLGFASPVRGLLLVGAERPQLPVAAKMSSTASTPRLRISSSSRSRTQTKKPSRSIAARSGSSPKPPRSRARRNAPSSPASQKPATQRRPLRPVCVDEPADRLGAADRNDGHALGRETPARRTASVSRATLSLAPSTSTTARTCSTAPVCRALPPGATRRLTNAPLFLAPTSDRRSSRPAPSARSRARCATPSVPSRPGRPPARRS